MLTHPDSHLLFSPISLSRSLFLPLTVLNLLVSCVHNKAKSQRKGSCRWAVRTSLKERRMDELLNYILYYSVLYFIFLPVTDGIISSPFFLFFPHDHYNRRNQKVEITFLHVSYFSNHELSLLPPMLHVISWPLSLLTLLFVPRKSFYFFFSPLHQANSNLFFKPLLSCFL